MPASENEGNKEITGAIQDVLIELIGAARHEWWFAQDIQLDPQDDALVVLTTNRFMVDRVRRSLLEELQQAAMQVYGKRVPVRVQVYAVKECCDDADAELETEVGPKGTTRVSRQPRLTGLEDQEIEPNSDRHHRLDGASGPARSQRAGAAKRGASKPGRAQAGHAQAGNGNGAPRSKTKNKQQQAARTTNDEPRKLISLFGEPADGRGSSSAIPTSGSANGSASQGRSEKGDDGEANATRSAMATTSLSNFCVGPCNTLAHMAAKMVAEQPGSPSPLFFWGPAGTGKTHLLAAIRNELRNRHRLRRVVLLSAEQFTNDFTGAVRGSGLPAFRRRYRDVDALLIDDVQFVGGKRATLRELLYTVDSLLRGRCQLAFTADRPPLELEGLNEELAGRMAGGMVCPLRPLDRETRLAVLEGLADVTRTTVAGGVLEHLADELVGDGRILSGAFNHLRTLSAMLARPATWDELMTSAPDLIAAGRPAVNLGDIQKAVCDMFGLPAGSLASRGQHRSVSQPRMLAMYLARQYTRAAYSEIGQFFGDRSHSTVIAATKRVEDWISENTPLRRGTQTLAPKQAIEAIENLLRTG